MNTKSKAEFVKAFKIFQGEASILINKNRIKGKEEYDTLINSDNYRNLALPHLSRFNIYKNFVATFVTEVTESFKSIFVTGIKFDNEKQNEIFQYIRKMLDIERQNLITKEVEISKQKNTGQNLSVLMNEIAVLFEIPMFEFKENVILHIEKDELNESIKKKKDFKNRMTDIKWKFVWYVISFILGAIFGYILNQLVTQPNPQLKATASLTQSFDKVIGFSISE